MSYSVDAVLDLVCLCIGILCQPFDLRLGEENCFLTKPLCMQSAYNLVSLNLAWTGLLLMWAGSIVRVAHKFSAHRFQSRSKLASLIAVCWWFAYQKHGLPVSHGMFI